MGAAISIAVDGRTANGFTRQMKNLVDKLGWERPRVVKYAAIQFGRSMRSRTRKAKATRPVRIVYKEGKRGKGKMTNQNGTPYWAYTTYQGGKPVEKMVLANDRDAAKRNNLMKVRYSGLAKKAWGWLMHETFNSDAGASVKFTRPSGALKGRKGDASGKFYVHFHNGLDYALESLRGGQSSVTEAMSAASTNIRKKIERVLKSGGARA